MLAEVTTDSNKHLLNVFWDLGFGPIPHFYYLSSNELIGHWSFAVSFYLFVKFLNSSQIHWLLIKIALSNGTYWDLKYWDPKFLVTVFTNQLLFIELSHKRKSHLRRRCPWWLRRRGPAGVIHNLWDRDQLELQSLNNQNEWTSTDFM